MDVQLLTIGELSARSGISRSALRFYDECGLLPPAAVDDTTGYRHYQANQVARASLIRRLREAGLGIEAIRSYLTAGAGEQASMLDAHLESLEARYASQRAAVEALRHGEGAAVEVLRRGEGSSIEAVRRGGGTGVEALRRGGGTGVEALRRGEGPSHAGRTALAVAAATLGGRTLAEALGQVLPAAAPIGVPGRPELTGLLVELKDWSLRLVASDSHRLAIRDLVPDLATGPMRVLVAAPHLASLRHEIAASASCSLAEAPGGALTIDLDGERRVLERLEGEFPDYEQVLDGRPTGSFCLVGADELTAALGAVSGPVTFGFRSDHLLVGKRRIECNWDGAPLEVTLDARFVTEALAASGGPDVVIGAAEPLTPVTIRSADSGTFNVWIMPIRR
jgi:DNA-binding transcriptional MerR regulator